MRSNEDNFFPKKAFLTSFGEESGKSDTDALPVMKEFGNRLFIDETSFELMSEFLLVALSPKSTSTKRDSRITDVASNKVDSLIPDFDIINELKNEKFLRYHPNHNLYLKLFSIFPNATNSKNYVDHKSLFEETKQMISSKLVAIGTDLPSNDEIVSILSNLYLGYQGVGGNRDWCAQSFLPLCKNLLSSESIWKSTNFKKANNNSQILNFFEHNGHTFYSRGGEVLYLQVLLALSQDRGVIDSWLKESGYNEFYSKDSDRNPVELRKQLIEGLRQLEENPQLAVIGKIAEFINRRGNIDTEEQSEVIINMGWVPNDSWTDGYLFLQDLLHIFRTSFENVEWLKMIELACAFHLMRTMRNATIRFYKNKNQKVPFSEQIVIDSKSENRQLKMLSNQSLGSIRTGILLMLQELINKANLNADKVKTKINKRYGERVYLTFGKRIGLIVPNKGGNEHFVFNKSLLTFLVVSILNPNEKITFDSFLDQIKKRFGLVISSDDILKVSSYSNRESLISVDEDCHEWLTKMLDESGFIINLADSYSLVVNRAGEMNSLEV